MDNFSLFNESFNINKTSTYQLTIQLGENGYSYCIVDTIRKRYVGIKHVNFEMVLNEEQFFDKVKEILKTDAYLNKSYKGVDLIYVSQKSILIPNEYFDKSNLKTYFKFNHQLSDLEEIHFNKLKNASANLVFAIPSYLTTLFVNTFPEINFFHQATSLVENRLIKNNERNFNYNTVLVHFHKNFFDAVVTKGNELLLYNTFNFQNENDYIYYLVNLYQRLGLKSEETELVLLGDIKENSNFHRLTTHYLPNMRFAKINSNTAYFFDTIPQHLFSNILDLNRCE